MVKISYIEWNISEVLKLCNSVSKIGLLSELRMLKSDIEHINATHGIKTETPRIRTGPALLVTYSPISSRLPRASQTRTTEVTLSPRVLLNVLLLCSLQISTDSSQITLVSQEQCAHLTLSHSRELA